VCVCRCCAEPHSPEVVTRPRNGTTGELYRLITGIIASSDTKLPSDPLSTRAFLHGSPLHVQSPNGRSTRVSAKQRVEKSTIDPPLPTRGPQIDPCRREGEGLAATVVDAQRTPARQAPLPRFLPLDIGLGLPRIGGLVTPGDTWVLSDTPYWLGSVSRAAGGENAALVAGYRGTGARVPGGEGLGPGVSGPVRVGDATPPGQPALAMDPLPSAVPARAYE
jgi:hypothetical protein